MTAPSRWSDKEVEQWVGNLLRAGVLLAAAVTLLGGIIFLIHHGAESASYRDFTPEGMALRSLGAIFSGAVRLDSRSLVQCGVVLLIATPVARVVLSLVAFIIQRDRLYTAITGIVLAILLFSLFFSGKL